MTTDSVPDRSQAARRRKRKPREPHRQKRKTSWMWILWPWVCVQPWSPDLSTTPTSPHTTFCGFTIMGSPWAAGVILIFYLGWYFLVRRQFWRSLGTPQNPMLLTADPSTLPPAAESTGANGIHGERSPPPTGVQSIAPVYVGFVLAHLICNIYKFFKLKSNL